MSGRPALRDKGSTTSLHQEMVMSPVPGEVQDGNETPGLDVNDHQNFLQQLFQWLQEERAKRAKPSSPNEKRSKDYLSCKDERSPTVAHANEQDLALDKLERILTKYATSSLASKAARRHSTTNHFRKASIAKKFVKDKLSGGVTSDTDGADAVAVVPHVEASLDNSKTLSYAKSTDADAQVKDKASEKEDRNWEIFKQEIIRILHTLNLRGWRRLSIDYGKHVRVERLSGALTNAVYVVKPPGDIELFNYTDDNGEVIKQKRLPKPLLLRIYGPQVEHLIDRENELMILRRLAAKNIGPKLLGYFSNGRFEEFLHAQTLTPEDLRDPSTSKQIAKRMKELHEGIDLLHTERNGGPFVFSNWDKWVDRVEKVISYLDSQVQETAEGKGNVPERYVRRGLICGVEWSRFKKAYNEYRQRLLEESGGPSHINEKLVFAHNDTQYGNLMRIKPDDKSPLLQPTNQHKQLVVIDFEYSSANTIGLEFANHFTEWCYNYHHAERPWACNTTMYPTVEEQYRFVRAYVMHRPQFAAHVSSTPGSTPSWEPREKTNIPDFMLDARTPSGTQSGDYDAEERAREQAQEETIQRLLHETRLWRIANTAQWVAWGIVQAKIPELDEPKRKSISDMLSAVKTKLHIQSDPLDEEVKARQQEAEQDRPEGRLKEEEEHHEGDETVEEEFDYLAYAQDRAMFFWGDCIQMGIVKEEDLPKEMLPHIKYVKY